MQDDFGVVFEDGEGGVVEGEGVFEGGTFFDAGRGDVYVLAPVLCGTEALEEGRGGCGGYGCEGENEEDGGVVHLIYKEYQRVVITIWW